MDSKLVATLVALVVLVVTIATFIMFGPAQHSQQEPLLTSTLPLSVPGFMRLNIHQPRVAGTVPKRIWQTWHSLPLPEGMSNAVQVIRDAHPGYEHVVMDDAMCYNYIKTHFPANVGDAFQTLVPGAFKADLWRLCVMYHDGGIYLDIKFKVVPPFTFDALLAKSHFVLDRPILSSRGFRRGIYNAFMACVPGDPRILACIQNIVKNVQTKYYGRSRLEPTGPVLVSKHVNVNSPDVSMVYKQSMRRNDVRSVYARSKELKLQFGDRPLIECFSGYTKEQNKTQKQARYTELYKQRNIYGEKNTQQAS